MFHLIAQSITGAKIRKIIQEQGDDRSFTASLVKDGGRHGLSDYEKSWVSASM
jgi:hypothetical protein